MTDILSPVEQFGLALTSLTPAALASVILLLVVLVISLVAHAYRKKLPVVHCLDVRWWTGLGCCIFAAYLLQLAPDSH